MKKLFGTLLVITLIASNTMTGCKKDETCYNCISTIYTFQYTATTMGNPNINTFRLCGTQSEADDYVHANTSDATYGTTRTISTCNCKPI